MSAVEMRSADMMLELHYSISKSPISFQISDNLTTKHALITSSTVQS